MIVSMDDDGEKWALTVYFSVWICLRAFFMNDVWYFVPCTQAFPSSHSYTLSTPLCLTLTCFIFIYISLAYDHIFFLRIGLFPIVSPAHVTKGLSAKEWCDSCIAVAVAAGSSGKGGGRPEQANATIAVTPEVDMGSLLEAARVFAGSKLQL